MTFKYKTWTALFGYRSTSRSVESHLRYGRMRREKDFVRNDLGMRRFWGRYGVSFSIKNSLRCSSSILTLIITRTSRIMVMPIRRR
jgi:hypothetical protein